jgi:hypothetical protein
MRESPRRTWAGLLGWLAAALGCAGPFAVTDAGYRHRQHDYAIAAPDGSGPAWERVEVEGATLAFRRAGPDTISLVSRCGQPVAAPQIMARHLVIGVPDRTEVASGPIQVAGRSGWVQRFDVTHGGLVVRVKTISLVADGCSFDWMLASSGGFEAAESAFDAWWQSLRLDSARYGAAP